jgi:hypothetical protein
LKDLDLTDKRLTRWGVTRDGAHFDQDVTFISAGDGEQDERSHNKTFAEKAKMTA